MSVLESMCKTWFESVHSAVTDLRMRENNAFLCVGPYFYQHSLSLRYFVGATGHILCRFQRLMAETK